LNTSTVRRRSRQLAFALLPLAFAIGAALAVPATPAASTKATGPASVDEALYKAMHWRGIGPYRGGRALAVTGVPGEPGVFYFGAVAGGVWKTIDSGATWTPIFDSMPMSSIGAIAVAPSDHKTIYVGSGEGALRGNITYGDGVYKSTDGGKTWANIGLKDTRQIGALIVDPTNPNIVLVAAVGHAFGANTERGVFRTTDGGKTWNKVLYKDENTGAIDVTFDPHDPHTVYAAMWQVRRQPWNFSSGGPGSGLYRSSDEGATWTEVKGNGLPDGILGRIDVAVSGADSKRVYAMVEANQGGLYRSDDSGQNWKLITQDGRVRQRAWYFSKIYADPKSVDTLYSLNTGMLRSTNGGKDWTLLPAPHGDHHGLWIDPTDPARLINANDGGATVSLDSGATWSTLDNQPTAQFYHVAVDTNRFPYWVYGAQQDNSNLTTASFDDEGVIGPRVWFPAGGGECGFVIPDPRNPNIIYSSSENYIARFDKSTNISQDISAWPIDNSGHPASELAHRFNWTSPLMLSPHDPDTLYAASEAVWKSTDHGHSWTIISPDLTRNDRDKQIASGGPLTKDITSVEYYDTIFALAESPLKKGMLWVGTDDGLVQTSIDDGGHWTAVTPAGMPQWSSIDMVEPSHYDGAIAYVAADRHKLDDIKPYAYKTTDGGKTWTSIVNGLPDGAVVHAVREDTVRRGLLYAATERGVYVSFDDGGHWQSLQLNLPATPIHDLVVKGDDLVVATHGRSFWILDNVTPLRQIQSGTAAESVVLYAPQTAMRLHYPDAVDLHAPHGENPPAGAQIDYYLKTAPKGELTIEILDGQGKVLRHLSSTHSTKLVQPPEWPDQIVPNDQIAAKQGMNRLVWDMRMNDPAQIPGAFYSGPTPRGPLLQPGQYQVKLSVDGVTRTSSLTVVADPRSGNSEAAIRAKTELSLSVEHDIDQLHRAVNGIRKTRSELERVNKELAKHPSDKALIAESDALSKQLDPLEQNLMQVNMKGSEANLAFPGMLNELLATFALSMDDADTMPTQQHLASYQSMHDQLQTQLGLWKKLQGEGIAPFNAHLKASGVVPVASE
jgi:photosystem II stability/assembly factor-like uncharacterized protein